MFRSINVLLFRHFDHLYIVMIIQEYFEYTIKINPFLNPKKRFFSAPENFNNIISYKVEILKPYFSHLYLLDLRWSIIQGYLSFFYFFTFQKEFSRYIEIRIFNSVAPLKKKGFKFNVLY